MNHLLISAATAKPAGAFPASALSAIDGTQDTAGPGFASLVGALLRSDQLGAAEEAGSDPDAAGKDLPAHAGSALPLVETSGAAVTLPLGARDISPPDPELAHPASADPRIFVLSFPTAVPAHDASSAPLRDAGQAGADISTLLPGPVRTAGPATPDEASPVALVALPGGETARLVVSGGANAPGGPAGPSAQAEPAPSRNVPNPAPLALDDTVDSIATPASEASGRGPARGAAPKQSQAERGAATSALLQARLAPASPEPKTSRGDKVLSTASPARAAMLAAELAPARSGPATVMTGRVEALPLSTVAPVPIPVTLSSPGAASGTVSLPDLAAVIDRLVETRQSAAGGRVHMSVAHQDFGMIGIRLDPAAGAGLAGLALTSMDPDFAPAVKAALAERPANERHPDGTEAPARPDPHQPRHDGAGQHGPHPHSTRSHSDPARAAAPKTDEAIGAPSSKNEAEAETRFGRSNGLYA